MVDVYVCVFSELMLVLVIVYMLVVVVVFFVIDMVVGRLVMIGVENIVVIIDVYMVIKIDVNLLDIYMWMFIIFLVSGFFYFIIDFISEFI